MLGLGQKTVCIAFVVVVILPNSPSHAYGTSDDGQWGGVGGGTQVDPHQGGQQSGSYNPSGQGYGNPNSGYQTEGHGSQYQPGSGNPNYFGRQSHIEKYGFPDGCVKFDINTCNYFVEISREKEDPEYIHFELSGKVPKTGGYVAVGLSEDEHMGDDHIVECVKLADNSTRYYQSWSFGRKQPRRLQDDPRIIKMQDKYPKYDYLHEILTCRFRRPIETSVEIDGRYKRFNLLEPRKFHILLARGNLGHTNSDAIGFHGVKNENNVYASHGFLGDIDETYPTTSDPYRGGHFNGSGLSISSIRLWLPFLFVSMLLCRYIG
ncbi:putative ferric-chelate reductase 1 [Orchesella cincta]|uniref:Putative ferric-chelate reductase 1 n=1 Tax=Orchesella cincta TaxID=48709 RepID=A0A1D2NIL4_ORCCI|nr:putative ferric-chelate reductase 1 [Orchesella cincta]